MSRFATPIAVSSPGVWWRALNSGRSPSSVSSRRFTARGRLLLSRRFSRPCSALVTTANALPVDLQIKRISAVHQVNPTADQPQGLADHGGGHAAHLAIAAFLRLSSSQLVGMGAKPNRRIPFWEQRISSPCSQRTWRHGSLALNLNPSRNRSTAHRPVVPPPGPSSCASDRSVDPSAVAEGALICQQQKPLAVASTSCGVDARKHRLTPKTSPAAPAQQ
ncbi:MAG: hypothetical protein CM15mP77_4100 [Synechococcus sp.]|nr:MAG: hypothetical protein CM15mP77_4100 [Synechococcus sp.]